MRNFHIHSAAAFERGGLQQVLDAGLPAQGFVWIISTRNALETRLPEIQATLQQLCGHTLLDLHISDLLNWQLPSHYDYTLQYGVPVFRRLTTRSSNHGAPDTPQTALEAPASPTGLPIQCQFTANCRFSRPVLPPVMPRPSCGALTPACWVCRV